MTFKLLVIIENNKYGSLGLYAIKRRSFEFLLSVNKTLSFEIEKK